ncbi:hypothetical protein K3495_g12562 [Podosphaera aphanis]|nr:hypothetical protein K3495_g12562 [Podosphaera aphanis]
MTFGFLRIGIVAAAGLPTLPYTASFQTPTIQLNKTAAINYQVNLTAAESTVQSLSISLCQTSSKTLLTADDTNSWTVLTALSDICLTNTFPDETCKNKPYEGRESLQLNLTTDASFNVTGDDTLTNFFFCFSNGASKSSIICDYSSSLFDISPAVSGSKPVDLDTLDTMPTSFPPPTHLSLAISTAKSTLLVIQTPPPLTPSSIPVPVSPNLPKKPLATGVKIGIGFGILSIFVLFGFLGLFLLRRSRLKKASQANRSLDIDSFPDTNNHHEKNNCGLPTTPSGWANSQTRTLIPGQTPGQESGDTTYNRQMTPVPGSSAPMISSKNIELDGNEPISKPPVHNRRSMSVVSRESTGTVSISSIPSPQSTVFDIYKDGLGNQARMSVGMGMGIGSTAPFLREEGMTPEELARLEDEERRIDAAIAEAEAERALNGRR